MIPILWETNMWENGNIYKQHEIFTPNFRAPFHFLEWWRYLQASLIQQQAGDVNALQDNAALQLARCEAVQQRLEEAEEKLEEAQQLGGWKHHQFLRRAGYFGSLLMISFFLN